MAEDATMVVEMALTVPVRAALVGAASVVALAVGIIAGLGPEPLQPCRDDTRSRALRPFCDLFRTSEPLFSDGHRTSLGDAASLAKHPLYLPARLPTALADERPEVWILDRQVGIRYRSGGESRLVVTYGLWPPREDPGTHYVRYVRDLGGGRTVSMDGWPGLVVPPNAGGPRQPPVTTVAVTIDRTEVRLYGRVPVQELIGIAESLQRVRSR